MNNNEFWAYVDRAIEQLRAEGFNVKFADEINSVDSQRLFNTRQNARPTPRPMYNNS